MDNPEEAEDELVHDEIVHDHDGSLHPNIASDSDNHELEMEQLTDQVRDTIQEDQHLHAEQYLLENDKIEEIKEEDLPELAHEELEKVEESPLLEEKPVAPPPEVSKVSPKWLKLSLILTILSLWISLLVYCYLSLTTVTPLYHHHYH